MPQRCGPASLAGVDPAEARPLARLAGIRRGCSGTLTRLLSSTGRSGIWGWLPDPGGEVACGFYYPGQRQQAVADTALVHGWPGGGCSPNEAVASGCPGDPLWLSAVSAVSAATAAT